jgi:hypothetical protein
MSSGKGLVLDPNILIRAVLGKRVRSVLEKYEDSVEFYAPDLCFEQAARIVTCKNRSATCRSAC